ncbi:MAG: cell division protein CrgA [Ilumatobacter sp.]|uniref:cell division protein CrgA n=1 Tax=Ilumatobacter sp. TaxID=1967498 RepID=UPI003297BC32
MAPPKRKTGGGRVTPKGTRPGDRAGDSGSTASSDDSTVISSKASGSKVTAAKGSGSKSSVAASSRYTPKAQRRQLIPPNMVPVLMCALLIIGGLVIMAGYLAFDASRWATGIGLICILGGLWFATKWE